MKNGLVLEGGSMRGLFTAGVIDVFLENNITFDGAAAVSAGAAFGCNYKSKQIGRVLRYTKRFCKYWKFCSFRSWIFTGDVFGAKFCYYDIPLELDVFDDETFRNNPMDFYVVATDINTVSYSCRNSNLLAQVCINTFRPCQEQVQQVLLALGCL